MKKQVVLGVAMIFAAINAYTRIDINWSWIAPSPLLVYTFCVLIAIAVFLPNPYLVTSLFVASLFSTFVNAIAIAVIFWHSIVATSLDGFKEWFASVNLFFCNVAIAVLLNDYNNEIHQKSFVSSLAKL